MPSKPVTGAAPATRSTAAILAVVVLVAVNLRLALSSLPAVATLIQDETGSPPCSERSVRLRRFPILPVKVPVNGGRARSRNRITVPEPHQRSLLIRGDNLNARRHQGENPSRDGPRVLICSLCGKRDADGPR